MQEKIRLNRDFQDLQDIQDKRRVHPENPDSDKSGAMNRGINLSYE
jgi:hypothetical protein